MFLDLQCIQLLLYFVYYIFQVCEKCKTVKHPSQELWWSHMSLVLPLFSNHFSGGRLVLQCVAQVADLYQQDTELVLYSERDPVPERGEQKTQICMSFGFSYHRILQTVECTYSESFQKLFRYQSFDIDVEIVIVGILTRKMLFLPLLDSRFSLNINYGWLSVCRTICFCRS